MVRSKLMVELRGLAGSRKMTLAELARAAEMHPSNLRRMLTSAAANPRLDTVMRLLGPLRAAVGPSRARTAPELIEHLDGERRRRDLTWESLLGGEGRRATAINRCLHSDPGMLPCDVVMRIADALEIDLRLIADDADDAEPVTASTLPQVHDRDRDAPPRRRSRGRPREAVDAGAKAPRRAPEQMTPRPAAGTPLIDERPADTPPPSTAATWPPPLRPARLGRYRDAPPDPPRPRPAEAATTAASTRARRSEPEYPLERALLDKLADVSVSAWRRVYRGLGRLVARDAPTEMLDDLADRTADALGHLRRSSPAREDPEPLTMIDVRAFLVAWVQYDRSNAPTEGTCDAFDLEGNPLVAHLCHDQQVVLAVRPGDADEPPVLTKILRGKPRRLHSDVHVPLVVKIQGSPHAFAHVPAGPVLGEIRGEGFGYLLGGVSESLTIIEVTLTSVHAVWYGRAEELPEVDLTPPGVVTREDAPAAEPPEPADVIEVEVADTVSAVDQETTALTVELDATRRQLAEEQAAGAALGQQVKLAYDLLELMAKVTMALWIARDRLTAELEEARSNRQDELAEEKVARVEAQERADALAQQVGVLAEELLGAEARVFAIEQGNAELGARLSSAEAGLVAESEAPNASERGHSATEPESRARDDAEVRARVEAEARTRAAVEAELATTRDALATANEARQALEGQVEVLSNIRRGHEARSAALARERDDACAALESTRGDLSRERDEALTALEAQAQRHAEAMAALEATTAERVRERDEALAALAAQTRRCDEAQVELATVRAERDAVQTELWGQVQELNARLERIQERSDADEDQSARPMTFAQKWRKKKPSR